MEGCVLHAWYRGPLAGYKGFVDFASWRAKAIFCERESACCGNETACVSMVGFVAGSDSCFDSVA